jgi:hypothetical protein
MRSRRLRPLFERAKRKLARFRINAGRDDTAACEADALRGARELAAAPREGAACCDPSVVLWDEIAPPESQGLAKEFESAASASTAKLVQ